MTVNSATAMLVIAALREAAYCASDTLDTKASKVNTLLSYLASPAPPTLSNTLVPPLVRMLFECCHVGMTGTHGWQIYRANQLISAVMPGVTTTNFEQAQLVLATLRKAYLSDSDTSVAQENYVNKLIAAIEAV